MNNKKYIVAMRDLLLKTLDEPEISDYEEVCVRIRSSIEDISEQPLQNQIQSIVGALDILQGYASIREILIRNLQPMIKDNSLAGYALIRKIIEPIFPEASSAPLYICPEDPTHYRRRVKVLEEPLICPLHRVELQLEK